MTNVAVFAESPRGTAGMISSYDRSGGNTDWANFSSARDGGFFILADLKGPGVIRRIWQTSIPSCQWLFYFDGEELPSLIMTSQEMFNGESPFCPPLSVSENGAACTYVPIPYSKLLKIRIKLDKVPEGSRPFFQINYETFPKDTSIKSFKLSQKDLKLAKKVEAFWNELPLSTSQDNNADVQNSSVIRPNESKCVLNETSSGTIDAFAIRIKNNSSLSYTEQNQLLRAVWMRICWDNSDTSSVYTPLGDFFCNGLRRRPFNSLPIQVTDEWFESRLPMPYKTGAKIEIINYSKKDINIDFKAFLSNYPLSDNSQYFHARWTQELKGTNLNYQALSTKGQGHYVGCYFISHSMDGSWNNLEGDETFIVDGTLSIHGTGLEDYFNGGWYYRELLARPLHGLVEKAAMNTSQYRFHLTTPVAFKNSLDVNFEFGNEKLKDGYMSSVAYWYQNEPTDSGTIIDTNKNWYPPENSFATETMMSELFELERKGEFAECARRSGYFSEQLADSEDGHIYKARQIAYMAQINGYENVSNEIENLKQKLEKNSTAFKELELIQWFNTSENKVLLSAMSGGNLKLYLDGKEIGQTKDQITLETFPVTILSGKHTLSAELKPLHIDNAPGFLVNLNTHSANVIDTGWEYSKTRPTNWPNNDNTATNWLPVEFSNRILPVVTWWYFKPNAMPQTQSDRQV
ncbi:MAG: DUF2961 domain-containing protein, partial [Kiritimatiellae bacterium]|nr:DUF2961 domain-containing protein [Kiritimatiellia bacterium]